MKEKWMGLAFLVPFGFLGLWADWAYGWGWAWVLLGAMAVFAGSCVGRTWAWLAGNGLSFGISVLCVELLGLAEYNYYFKPLGAVGFAAVFYGVTLVLAWLVRKKQWLILGLVLGGVGAMVGTMYWLQLSL